MTDDKIYVVRIPTRDSLLFCVPALTADLEQANAGDSRSVLGVKGRAKPLSFDHKPQNEGTHVSACPYPRPTHTIC